MKIIKAKDYQDMSKKAAIVIASQVTMKPDCVLGLIYSSSEPYSPHMKNLISSPNFLRNRFMKSWWCFFTRVELSYTSPVLGSIP